MVTELQAFVNCGEREKSDRLLNDLRRHYPIPTVDILKKEVWETDKDIVVLRTHAPVDIADAVRNVEVMGRKLSQEEVEGVQLLAVHWCGWSATPIQHRNDPWVQYLRYAYPALDGAQPVLDSLIWADEIVQYPLGHVPRQPFLFLFATLDKFYIFNYADNALMEAGESVAEVVEGMKKERWREEPMWQESPAKGSWDPCDYFPVYDDVPHTTEAHALEREIKEFRL